MSSFAWIRSVRRASPLRIKQNGRGSVKPPAPWALALCLLTVPLLVSCEGNDSLEGDVPETASNLADMAAPDTGDLQPPGEPSEISKEAVASGEELPPPPAPPGPGDATGEAPARDLASASDPASDLPAPASTGGPSVPAGALPPIE